MKRCIVTFLFLWMACIGVSGNAAADNVLLWNKLGSVDEVANSEIGPGFQQTSYKFADWQEAQIVPGQFGNGLFVNHDINEGWTNDGGNFFATNLNDVGITPDKGTIEFWFTFKYGSNTHNHSMFFQVGNMLTDHFPSSDSRGKNAYITAGWNGWDYGSYGKRFFFSIGNASDSSAVNIYTPDYSAAPGGHLDFNDGTTFHFACVWDVNGIDGTADTVRLYVNGNVEASSNATWTTAGGFDPYLYVGSFPGYAGWDHYYNSVKGVTDNIVIRDYAKTDFSDRFREKPVIPPVKIISHQKISALEGGFGAGLQSQDLFGHDVASLGDIDGDGNGDVAVGAFGDDDGGFNTGAVWIIFLNADGTVKAKQKISETAGGFGGSLNTNALFGSYLASLDDLDGDGVTDLVVGNYGDDDGGVDRGAAWVIFLNTDGTVKREQKISDLQGGFGGSLDNSDFFGRGLAKVGDLDGDGVTEIAIGAVNDDDGGLNRGAVWILFMNSDGTVKAEQKISDTQGGFNGNLDDGDIFGQAIASIGDIDSDGVPDLAVGSTYDDDGGTNQGALWILFMNTDGTVKDERKISAAEGDFLGILHDSDSFGWSIESVGDLDMDGIPDLITGATYDDDGGTGRGAVWLLRLNADGSVKAEHKISATAGGFNGSLSDGDSFGSGVTLLTDLDGNGVPDLMVSARGDADGGNATGAVWILFLERNLALALDVPEQVSAEATGPSGAIVNYSVSATSVNGPSPTVACTPLSGSQFALGDTTVNCTATDTAGNSASGSFVVSVTDTTAPVLTTSADMTAEGDTAGGADVTLPTASATDIVDAAPTVVCDHASGFFPLGDTTVNCTATDASSNNASGSFIVKVADTTAPVLTPPANMTVEGNTAGGANVTLPTANVSDIVDAAPTVVCDHSSGFFPLGDTTVNCTATDGSGNSSNDNYLVQIRDTAAPFVQPYRVSTSKYGWLEAETFTSFPAKVGASPISLETRALDVVGINTVSIEGNPAQGGPEFWSSAGITLLEGDNTLSVQAIDTSGNTTEKEETVVLNLDLDRDRIRNDVDRQPKLPSYEFSDQFTTGLGRGPIDVAITPDGQHLYTANYYSGSVSVIDADTQELITTVQVGGNPYALAMSPDGMRIYAANINGQLSIIDTFSNSVVAAPGYYGLRDVAVHPDGKEVYVSSYYSTGNSYVMALDTATNQWIASTNLSDLITSLALSLDGRHLFASRWNDGAVFAIDTATHGVVSSRGLGDYVYAIAVHPITGNIYAGLWNQQTVTVLDENLQPASTPINVNCRPYHLTFTPDGSRLLASCINEGSIAVIDPSSGSLVKSIPVPQYPSGSVFNPGGTQAYVASYGGNALSVIDVHSGWATDTIQSDTTAGTTFGEVVDFGDQYNALSITDWAPPYGLRVSVDSSGGAEDATIQPCGTTFSMKFGPGDDAEVYCSSVGLRVLTGSVEMAFETPEGAQGLAEVTGGNELVLKPSLLPSDPPFSIEVPLSNTSPVTVEIDGESVALEPGETAVHTDGDSIPDDRDNCPTVANQNQADQNDDGFGDACVPLDVDLHKNTSITQPTVIGSGTIIKKDSLIGTNSQIGSDVIIDKEFVAGENLRVGSNTDIDKAVRLGDNVNIGEQVYIRKEVVMGDGVTIGDETQVAKGTQIGTGVMIGKNCEIGSNVQIGERIIIGDGAVLEDETVIPDGTIITAGSTTVPDQHDVRGSKGHEKKHGDSKKGKGKGSKKN